MVWGFSRCVLFLGLVRAPTRSSPERVRDTIWTFPEQSRKPPSLETPRFSFFGFGKRGLLEKGSFQESPFENPQTLKNKGESDHFLEILENLETLEILEISPVKSVM